MLRNLIICFIAGVLAACGVADTKKVNDLNLVIDEYVAALRWARVDDAGRFHMNRDGSRPELDTSAMDRIRVTGYKIKKKTLGENLEEAAVTAELDYYSTEHGTLKHMTLEQDWWYNEEAKRWYLESDFPTFE
ncbi:MAG: hypothetical protein WD750_09765 [Gammaproteobacteria bacterium]